MNQDYINMGNVIKKTVNIEDSISRVRGLIPTTNMGVYKYDNSLGEWKKDSSIYENEEIVFSIDDFTDTNKSYFLPGFSGKNGRMGNWGKTPNDIIINKNDSEAIYNFNLPYDIIREGKKVLRYSNIMKIYYWLNKFIKTSSVYRLCTRKNNKEWILHTTFSLRDFYSPDSDLRKNINIESIEVFNNLNLVDNNNYDIGSIIVVNNSLYNEYVKYFGGNILYNSIILYNFIEEIQGKLYIPERIEGTMVPSCIDYYDIKEWYEFLNKNQSSTNKSIKYKYENMGGDVMRKFLEDKLDYFNKTVEKLAKMVYTPYLTIPILINNKIDDMGIYNTYSQEWMAGKKYYVGDTVIYTSEEDTKGSSYTLKYGSGFELIEFTQLDNKFNTNSYTVQTYNDEKMIIGVCKLLINNTKSSKPHFIDLNNKKIIFRSGTTKKYYLPLAFYYGYQDINTFEVYFDETDESGNLIHWESNCGEYIKNNNVKENGTTDSVIISHGYSKLSTFERLKKDYDDDNIELHGIIEYDENGDIKTNLDLPYLINIPLNIVNIYNEEGELVKRYGDLLLEPIENNEKITFEYYIGCEINNNSERVNNTGIKYTETYLFSNLNEERKVDGIVYNFTYKNIELGENKRLNIAEVTHNSGEFYKINENNNSYEYINSLLYKDESSLGVATPFKINVNVNIDRGNTTAYDKYYMLTEVKNLEDLEQYRNNFFNIKK